MIKDGCNNMEKNKILKYHDEGHDADAISRELKLTERIVNSIIGHYHPDSVEAVVEATPDPKPTKKKARKKTRKKKKAKDTAADDFK